LVTIEALLAIAKARRTHPSIGRTTGLFGVILKSARDDEVFMVVAG
jgi:hypothetical protein